MISVACKALGIGADVYWDKDRTKYTEPQKTADDAAPKPVQKPKPMPKPETPQKQMATAEQIEYILTNIDYQNYEAATAAFGSDLEKMTFKQAEKLIERIKNTEVDGNAEAV